MVAATPITNKDRFLRADSACPICGGWDHQKRGYGERCCGFRSGDEYVVCTREEYAGNLEQVDSDPPGYRHRLKGDCGCGRTHGYRLEPVRKERTPRPARQRKADENPYLYNDPRMVAQYHYTDRAGNRLFTIVRYQEPDGNGGYTKTFRPFRWQKGLPISGQVTKDQRVLYRLTDLLTVTKEQTVYIAEGEKGVDAVRRLGLIATCSPGGAVRGEGNSDKWLPQYNDMLKGLHIAILPDNDEPGREHASFLVTQLTEVAASIRVVELPGLPEKGDVFNWIEQGGTKEDIERIVQAIAPRWEAPKRKFLYASEVETKPVPWLWKKRIARGMLTLMVGDPGIGKSSVTSAITSSITRGGMLPDNDALPGAGGVIIMAPEDSDTHTIVPRLVAAGADLSKIILLSKVTETDKATGTSYERPISFPDDAHILEEAITDCGAVLAIIDPVLATIDQKYDTHKDQSMRVVLGRVMAVAEKQGCAVLGIVHLNKGQNSNALYRSGASIALVATARIGLYIVHDPDNEEGGVIVNHKNNLANQRKTASIRYAFHETPQEIGYIAWNGESEHTQEELLNQGGPVVLNNRKSEEETDILAALEENKIAMTVAQILPRIQTGQSADALERMLRRKADQGVLIRPARGLYTYAGNPLYTAEKPMSDMSGVSVSGNTIEPMSDVSESTKPCDEPDIKSTMSDMSVSKTAPGANSTKTDISDIEREAATRLFDRLKHAIPLAGLDHIETITGDCLKPLQFQAWIARGLAEDKHFPKAIKEMRAVLVRIEGQ